MKIQNPALAGVTLALRFHPGDTATGDVYGIFDLPQEDADFLLSTSCWRLFDPEQQAKVDAVARQHAAAQEASRSHEAFLQAIRVEQIAAQEAAQAAAVVVKADEKAAVAAYNEAKALESIIPPSLPPFPVIPAVVAEGPDLEAMDRDQLIQTAIGYGVEIDRRWGAPKIRETIDAALYGDEPKG